MKKFIIGITVIVLLALLPLLTLTSIQDRYAPATTVTDYELRAEAADIFAKSLTYKTISQVPQMIDSNAFNGLLQHIQHSFPEVYTHLEIDTLSTHTLWMHLKGSTRNAENLLFISHLDVVPVDAKTRKDWDADPYSGDVVGDYIYGRGTLDDKASAFAILEALETLLKNQWIPEENFYFCFGQDEEIGGGHGAKIAAEYCRNNALRFRTIFDEAGTITSGSIPGLGDTPVALIGTAEKGYLSVEVSFEQPGGHSSMPEKENAINSAAAFITSLTQDPLFPAEFTEPLQGFMDHLAPEMNLGLKWAFSLRPLTNSILLNNYQQSATGRALTSNTAVATMMSSGIKDNVVPSYARVVCNTRILPGYSLENIVEAYQQRANNFGGTVEWYNDYGSGPTRTSSSASKDFIAIGNSIKTLFPEALISPYLTLGGTDSKNFEGLSDNTYRFLPVLLTPQDFPRIHGINERIAVSEYLKMCQYYSVLLQSL